MAAVLVDASRLFQQLAHIHTAVLLKQGVVCKHCGRPLSASHGVVIPFKKAA